MPVSFSNSGSIFSMIVVSGTSSINAWSVTSAARAWLVPRPRRRASERPEPVSWLSRFNMSVPPCFGESLLRQTLI